MSPEKKKEYTDANTEYRRVHLCLFSNSAFMLIVIMWVIVSVPPRYRSPVSRHELLQRWFKDGLVYVSTRSREVQTMAVQDVHGPGVAVVCTACFGAHQMPGRRSTIRGTSRARHPLPSSPQLDGVLLES